MERMRVGGWGWLALIFLVCCRAGFAMEPIQVPMNGEHWSGTSAKANLEFVSLEGFPLGLLNVKSGAAVLKDFSFANGTIEFDVKTDGDGMPGIRFRQADAETAELVYLRPGPNCPASQDCLQYAPITKGAMQWDLFPRYQRPAPLNAVGWNHVKMIVSGRRMKIFINDSRKPVLEVGRLESGALQGGLRLQGPAVYANLSVTPDAVEGLTAQAVADPTDKDERYFRQWEVSGFSILPPGKAPGPGDAPSTGWQRVHAERDGLVNLSRLYATPDPGQLRCLAWMKTTVFSDQDITKAVAIGWVREVWVFVNGKLVVSGRNFWDPPGPKRTPDGRLSLENASFGLPLRKGRNEVVIAISNEESDSATHFGWGLKLRFEDRKGVSFVGGGR